MNTLTEQEREKAIQETSSQESVDLSKRGFLCKTGEKAIALTGINTVAKIGLLGTLGSLLVSEEAEAAKKPHIIKIGPYNLVTTKTQKIKYKGKYYDFPSEFDETALKKISIKDIDQHFIAWTKNLNKKNYIIYQNIIAQMALVIGKAHLKSHDGNKNTAREYLEAAEAQAKKTKQYYMFCKSLLYIAELENNENNSKVYYKKINHAINIIKKLKEHPSILEKEGAERMNLLLADIYILEGGSARTFTKEPRHRYNDLYWGKNNNENAAKLKQYQENLQLALHNYENAMKYASVQERPEAYYYAAEILMYFCVDRNNWKKAKSIYQQLEKLLVSTTKPSKEKKEWLKITQKNLDAIHTKMHNWIQFKRISNSFPEMNNELYIAENADGEIWFQHSQSEQQKNDNFYQHMVWFDPAYEAPNPNDFNSVAQYLRRVEYGKDITKTSPLRYEELHYKEVYKK